MLPGPGFLALVLRERFDVRDEHAALAARAQALIDFVEPPRAGMHRQQMHDALGESNEEHLVVERLCGAGFLLFTARVMQEDEIEIGRVAELHSTELAVTDG